jgi:hypothetical protein
MKKPFTLFSKLLPLALAWGLSLTAAAQITYSTVPLTAGSFTADVIANGAAALPPTSSATADVDNATYYLISQDYYTATTPHTSGIPNSGLIPNSIAGYSALTYQLASLSANNALQIRTAGGTGTLTFATPTAASELYVLGISGSGASTVTMTAVRVAGLSGLVHRFGHSKRIWHDGPVQCYHTGFDALRGKQHGAFSGPGEADHSGRQDWYYYHRHLVYDDRRLGRAQYNGRERRRGAALHSPPHQHYSRSFDCGYRRQSPHYGLRFD